MIDIFVRTIGERLHEQSLSMAAAGLGKMTQWVRTTGLDVRCPGRPLRSGAAERLGHARCCPPVALRRSIPSASQHRRVAVCGARLSGTLLLLASVRETSVIKISRSAKSVRVTFVLLADEPAAGCSVVGDFNGWQPGMHQLRRRSNGTRSASVALPLGTRTRFRYLGNNGHWFNDPDLVEFDGPDSVLAV